MFSLLVFLFVLGALIVVHEFGHFIIAKCVGVRVEKFSLGFGPRILRRKKNDTEYSLNAIPLGGFVKLAGDSLQEYTGKKDEYFYQPPGKRFWIIFCGPLLNYIVGFLFFWLIFFLGYPTLTTRVGKVLGGFGAEEAGLVPGDAIMEIDGSKVNTWDELQRIIRAKKADDTVRLSVVRNETQLFADVLIKEKEIDDALGKKHSVSLLGISPDDEHTIMIRHGPVTSFVMAAGNVWDITTLTYQALWRMVMRKMSFKESVTGPLGIYYLTSQAAHLGIMPLLHLVAVLSVSLAIFNLLPIPILDGGHIFFLGMERIRRKALSARTEQTITQIGFSLIITLAVFATLNDIVRIFGDKISRFLIR